MEYSHSCLWRIKFLNHDTEEIREEFIARNSFESAYDMAKTICYEGNKNTLGETIEAIKFVGDVWFPVVTEEEIKNMAKKYHVGDEVYEVWNETIPVEQIRCSTI